MLASFGYFDLIQGKDTFGICLVVLMTFIASKLKYVWYPGKIGRNRDKRIQSDQRALETT